MAYFELASSNGSPEAIAEEGDSNGEGVPLAGMTDGLPGAGLRCFIVPTFSLANGRVSPRPKVECGEELFDCDDSHLEEEEEDEDDVSSNVSELEDLVPPGLGFRIIIGLPST